MLCDIEVIRRHVLTHHRTHDEGRGEYDICPHLAEVVHALKLRVLHVTGDAKDIIDATLRHLLMIDSIKVKLFLPVHHVQLVHVVADVLYDGRKCGFEPSHLPNVRCEVGRLSADMPATAHQSPTEVVIDQTILVVLGVVLENIRATKHGS